MALPRNAAIGGLESAIPWFRAAVLALGQIIDFNDTYPRPTILTCNDRGIHSRNKTGRDSRLGWIRGHKSASTDLRRLARIVLPIIICNHERAIVIANFQSRIGQGIAHARFS